MTDTQTTTSKGGVGFLGLLGLLFIALKLIGTITWPWIWVLAPLWAIPALAIAIIIIAIPIIAVKVFIIDK